MEIALLDAPQPSDAEGGEVAAVDLVEDRPGSDAEKLRGLRNAHERRGEGGSALSHRPAPRRLDGLYRRAPLSATDAQPVSQTAAQVGIGLWNAVQRREPS